MTKATLQLEESVFVKLTAIAQGTNQTPEEFISSIVNGLDSEFDDDDALFAECEARWSEFEKTRLASPLDEILDWINSWNTSNKEPAPQCRPF
ncbi:MAG: hypothetical protein LBV79_08355 [Candidatus Adiutrix sp.]|jgi:predicted transcriptional regulator|nr:hypothetical protein [Candidatus Adiutrix sp.]